MSEDIKEMENNPVIAALRAQQERELKVEDVLSSAADEDDVLRMGQDEGVRFVDEDEEPEPAVADAEAAAAVEVSQSAGEPTEAIEPVAGERAAEDITRAMGALKDDQVRTYRAAHDAKDVSREESAWRRMQKKEEKAERKADRRIEERPSEQSWQPDTSGIDVMGSSVEAYAAVPRAGAAMRPSSAAAASAAPVRDGVLARVIDNVETVIVGKRESVELVVCALIAGGHVLIEDMPGTGKTSLVSALARSIDCGFRRIQFTPDVMPSDISGFSIFNQKTRDFEFRPGAVMTNIVLADEINRASAKTQSAMLEAMEERQVTVDGETHRLAEPFMVMATQNPIEQYGTYPLPEAQLDRFLIKLSMGYLKMDEEVQAILNADAAKEAIAPVATGAEVLALRERAKAVAIAPAVARYAVQLTAATRTSPECLFGASPRGSKALVSLARAYALLRGRSYVSPDDIKYLAPFVLSHRIALTHEAKMEGRTTDKVIASLLDTVAVPAMTEAEAKSL